MIESANYLGFEVGRERKREKRRVNARVKQFSLQLKTSLSFGLIHVLHQPYLRFNQKLQFYFSLFIILF